MKRLTVLAAVLLVCSFDALAQERPDSTAYAATTLSVYQRADSSSRVVGFLPVGQQVRVVACDTAWCNVRTSRVVGFVAPKGLTAQAPAAQPTGQGYINSQGQWVPSPQRALGNQPPAGATAQCRDGTYSFSRSRRGTCSRHGGVARWL